jgi:hypothetical protein
VLARGSAHARCVHMHLPSTQSLNSSHVVIIIFYFSSTHITIERAAHINHRLIPDLSPRFTSHNQLHNDVRLFLRARCVVRYDAVVVGKGDNRWRGEVDAHVCDSWAAELGVQRINGRGAGVG